MNLMGFFRQVFLFDTKKEPKKCPLLPTAREARLRSCSPLRTPKRWSRGEKAKTCRSAARFFTLFRPSPIAPSGAKTTPWGVELKAPLCKGGSADRRWGIVALPIYRSTLARAPIPPSALRTATSLYTREAFDSRNHAQPSCILRTILLQ